MVVFRRCLCAIPSIPSSPLLCPLRLLFFVTTRLCAHVKNTKRLPQQNANTEKNRKRKTNSSLLLFPKQTHHITSPMFRTTVSALKKLQPLGQRVLVKRTLAAKQTKAGVLIPEQVAGKVNEGT
ncbi:hypothetical protein TCSYLVIO_002349, partial [Trypanosoma cruzi]